MVSYRDTPDGTFLDSRSRAKVQFQYTKHKFPNTEFSNNLNAVLTNQDIDVVGIFTPPATHFKLSMKCLEAKKNILVTKPLCLNVEDAKKIKELAEKNKLEVFIDDTFLFSGHVEYLKNYFN